MAGTLVIDNLKASTGVLATQNGMTGIAKAWAKWTYISSVLTVNSSFNVSSVTRVSAGIWNLAFTTALSNGNYSICGASTNNGAGNYAISLTPDNTFTQTSSACQVATMSGASAVDAQQTSVAIFGA